MKLTKEILNSRASKPLESTQYLDLSDLGLTSLGKRLSASLNLETLILRGNCLQEPTGLSDLNLNQLWHLDLSSNQLVSLDGLSNFLAFGTLVLSNNQLTWTHLQDLRHMHIMSLDLHGNPALEADPYYRIHVIDCLPNVWMLDGRMITSAERILVHQFFKDSALNDRPVRHKPVRKGFQTSIQKKIEFHGLFGKKAVELMLHFSRNGVQNIETDWKRLFYLAKDCEEEIKLELISRGQEKTAEQFALLTYLFEVRQSNRERCNMLVILLIASLEFVLPSHLVYNTLETARLIQIGKVHTFDLFILPRALRCRVVCLLVSAVKLEREQNQDGGLYPKLYLCILSLIADLLNLISSPQQKGKISEKMRDYKYLLATEVVQLMCIVPSFCEYLLKDTGVMSLVRIATSETDIMEKISEIVGEADFREMDDSTTAKIRELILDKVHGQLQQLSNSRDVLSHCEQILIKSSALPMKGDNTPLFKADFLTRGINIPLDGPPVVYPHVVLAKSRSRFPSLGDTLLLGPQTLGKIISLPQTLYALVVVEGVPVSSGAVEHKLKDCELHYTYIDMELFDWDCTYRIWKPLGTVGDKFTLQSAPDFAAESQKKAWPFFSNIEGQRPNTPLIHNQMLTTPSNVPTDHDLQVLVYRRPQSSVYIEKRRFVNLNRRSHSAGRSHKSVKSSFSVHTLVKLDPQDASAKSKLTVSRIPLSIEHLGVVSAARSDTPASPRDTARGKENQPPATPTTPTRPAADPASGQLRQPGERTRLERSSVTHRGAVISPRAFSAKKMDHSELGKNKLTTAITSQPEIFITAMSDFPRPSDVNAFSGLTLSAGNHRPVTAKEREYYTDFQHQRVKKWRETTRPFSSGPKLMGSTAPPPPQPPSSPTPHSGEEEEERAAPAVERDASGGGGGPGSAAGGGPRGPGATRSAAGSRRSVSAGSRGESVLTRHLPNANLWLAGGRDLYREEVKARPKSSRSPGWRDGLPDSMARPRPHSAASSSGGGGGGGLYVRHSRSSTSSASLYDKRSFCLKNTLINQGADLPLESPLGGGRPLTRGTNRRSSAHRGLYDEDPLPATVEENVYR